MKKKLLIFSISVCSLLSCKRELLKNDSSNQNSENITGKSNLAPEMAFPNQTGEIRKGYYRNVEITYQRINGLNVFAGDIILPDRAITRDLNSPSIDGAIISGGRWPNNTIPYDIEAGFPNQFRITDAIANWQNNTPIKFVPRTNQTDFVRFLNHLDVNGFTAVSNGVGRVGGMQTITIGTNAITGNVIHEIGHALGLFHEHQRVDRNNFINVNFANIPPASQDQYLTYDILGITGGFTGVDVEPFDRNSIMMYGSFASNSIDQFTPVITNLDGSTFDVQRNGLSATDLDVATCVIGFSPWLNLGGNLTSKPAAISRMANSVNVFAKGQANQLMHIFWNGTAWSTWQDLGGNFQSAPCVSKRGTGIMDVFVRGTNNHLFHRYWTNNVWSNWIDLGGNIASAPASISRTSTTINVFARGQNNELLHIYWTGSAWSAWENLGGAITMDPTVSSRGSSSVDVFCRGANGQLLQKSWNGTSWLAFSDLGGQLATSPSAVSWSSNRIDIFYRRNDGALEERWWENSTWQTRPFGGLFTAGTPAITSQSVNSLNLFSLNNANQLMSKGY